MQRQENKPATQTVVSEMPASERTQAPDVAQAIAACDVAKPAQLPDKLSELLRLAVRDAQAVAAMSGYRLDMWSWRRQASGGTCAVCMAGAVMVNTVGEPPGGWRDDETSPRSYGPVSDSTATKLLAINCMRAGAFLRPGHLADYPVTTFLPIPGAGIAKAEAMGIAERMIKDDYSTARNSGRAKWETYLAAADVLEKAGL